MSNLTKKKNKELKIHLMYTVNLYQSQTHRRGSHIGLVLVSKNIPFLANGTIVSSILALFFLNMAKLCKNSLFPCLDLKIIEHL